MPNWCDNDIKFEGNAQSIEALRKVLEADNGKDLFERVVPLETGEDDDNWYMNHVEAWGTKWDVSMDDAYISYGTTLIDVSISTAWSPPLAWCRAVAKMFKIRYQAVYHEPGCDFIGVSFGDYENYTEESGDMSTRREEHLSEVYQSCIKGDDTFSDFLRECGWLSAEDFLESFYGVYEDESYDSEVGEGIPEGVTDALAVTAESSKENK